jgi:hypothetical protein
MSFTQIYVASVKCVEKYLLHVDKSGTIERVVITNYNRLLIKELPCQSAHTSPRLGIAQKYTVFVAA